MASGFISTTLDGMTVIVNQWNQPDSIIPDPYNPLDWNRYSYARNNPINLIDPSGRSVECGLLEPGCEHIPLMEEEMEYYNIQDKDASWQDRRREVIYNEAFKIKAYNEDALASFRDLVDFASGLYRPYEVDSFVSDLTCIIVGYCGKDPRMVFMAGDPNSKRGNFYVKSNFFPGQGSWSSEYYDYSDNQMYHFWFYVSLSYFDGSFVANIGTIAHGDVPGSPKVTSSNKNGGQSYQDFQLTIQGIELGKYINDGTVNLVEVGSWIFGQLSQPATGPTRPH